MKTVLGIFRAACYSPGMVRRDEAILRAVAYRMKNNGYEVKLIHEEDFMAETPMPDVVLHMVRSAHALDILQEWQDAGCCVINPVEGVRSVERATLAKWCAAQKIPTPKTWIVDTNLNQRLTCSTTEGEIECITFPCWVKRTGACAQEADDVCRVNNAMEYTQCLLRFQARNIGKVVVMEHIEGPSFKFYAVKGTDFFYCLPAEQLGYEKFSNNPVEKNRDILAWDVQAFKSQFSTANFPPEVYGGDFIVTADGVARLIDLNDWPSFSACREEAAKAITELVMNMK